VLHFLRYAQKVKHLNGKSTAVPEPDEGLPNAKTLAAYVL
jgi:hypothetical protein